MRFWKSDSHFPLQIQETGEISLLPEGGGDSRIQTSHSPYPFILFPALSFPTSHAQPALFLLGYSPPVHSHNGAEDSLKFPLPIPYNPGSHPMFVGSHLFALF